MNNPQIPRAVARRLSALLWLGQLAVICFELSEALLGHGDLVSTAIFSLFAACAALAAMSEWHRRDEPGAATTIVLLLVVAVAQGACLIGLHRVRPSTINADSPFVVIGLPFAWTAAMLARSSARRVYRVAETFGSTAVLAASLGVGLWISLRWHHYDSSCAYFAHVCHIRTPRLLATRTIELHVLGVVVGASILLAARQIDSREAGISKALTSRALQLYDRRFRLAVLPSTDLELTEPKHLSSAWNFAGYGVHGLIAEPGSRIAMGCP